MKRLYLQRHAKSSWSNSGLADHDRPLAGRGERDGPWIARRLRAHGAVPQLIIASSAVRARRTAQIIAAELGLPSGAVAIDPDLYLASPQLILATAKRTDDALSSIMLVGHNPGLTELAAWLAPQLELDNLPTAGVLAADFDVSSWTALDAPVLQYYDYPKNPGPPLGG